MMRILWFGEMLERYFRKAGILAADGFFNGTPNKQKFALLKPQSDQLKMQRENLSCI